VGASVTASSFTPKSLSPTGSVAFLCFFELEACLRRKKRKEKKGGGSPRQRASPKWVLSSHLSSIEAREGKEKKRGETKDGLSSGSSRVGSPRSFSSAPYGASEGKGKKKKMGERGRLSLSGIVVTIEPLSIFRVARGSPREEGKRGRKRGEKREEEKPSIPIRSKRSWRGAQSR